jgi:hypothetical protein
MPFFLLGLVLGLPLWAIIFKVLDKFENPLQIKDFESILPEPDDLNWRHLGTKDVPNLVCKGAQCYQLNNIKVYVGYGAYINNTYIRGSEKYVKRVLIGQTSNKMLQLALGS